MGICAVVMAAGEGKRMNSKKCKFVHKTAGKPVIVWVKEALQEAQAFEQVYIVGHLQEQVRQVLGEEVPFVLQEKQLGTGHAVMQASPFLEGRTGVTLVIRGDTPLITAATLKNVIKYYNEGEYAAVVITADTTEATGYGRIVRNADGDVTNIITSNFNGCADLPGNGSSSNGGGTGIVNGANNGTGNGYNNGFSGRRGVMFEGNSSMYCFNTALLVSVLGRIGCNNANKEYCLTDAIEILISDGRRVGAYKVPFEEAMGVHDKYQLMQVTKLLNKRICRNHMKNGVTIVDPDSTWIEASVRIERDTEILPNTILEGNTTIGEDSRIGPDTRITDSTIGDDVVVYNSIITGSKLETGSYVGPYSYVRAGSRIGAHARIGNSVEVKNSCIGAYSKALNNALIVDSDVGENVSYGSGCITANFDGTVQSRTKIGENSFIGSNSNLVAPVQISENTYIAAGSTITDDVPPYAMAIARSRQLVKDDWVLKKNRVRMR